MSSYSQTPWEVAADPGCGGCDWKEKYMVGRRSQTGDVVGVAVVLCNDCEKANADLIAAAPELLAACRAMLTEMQVWEGEQGTHPVATLARAAIAKAEGGAP